MILVIAPEQQLTVPQSSIKQTRLWKGSGLSLVRFPGMIFLFFARVGSVRFLVRLHPGVQLGIRAL